MTNVEQLDRIYELKRQAGLVDVKFVFSDSAHTATTEELAGEILALERAVALGHVTPLDFGDLSWKEADEGSIICGKQVSISGD